MKRIYASVIAFAAAMHLAGCGGHPPVLDGPGVQLDPRFEATWSGVAEVYYPEERRTAPTVLSVAIRLDGARAHVSGLCADGSGSFAVVGGGQFAEGRDIVQCPAPTPSCSSAVYVYNQETLTVSDDGQIYTVANGFHAGCNMSLRVTTVAIFPAHAGH